MFQQLPSASRDTHLLTFFRFLSPFYYFLMRLTFLSSSFPPFPPALLFSFFFTLLLLPFLSLADFGVSAQITATLAKRKSFIGTPYWLVVFVFLYLFLYFFNQLPLYLVCRQIYKLSQSASANALLSGNVKEFL